MQQTPLVVKQTNWNSVFAPVFGSTRTFISTRLETIGKIRNKVFHFRDEVTVNDYLALPVTRDWVLNLRTVHKSETGEPR